MKNYLFPILLSFFSNCTSVKLIEGHDEESKMENLAHSNFGEDYATKKNESGSHFIVFKKYKKLEDLFATVKFFIFEENSQSIIFQDELNAGSISWHSDFKIIAISRYMLTDANKKPSITYYYDVNKKTKTITKPILH